MNMTQQFFQKLKQHFFLFALTRYMPLVLLMTMTMSVSSKPRIIVLTDSEVDDRCSMVHLLLCSSSVDIAALIQTNSCFQRNGWSKEHWLEQQIDHYAEVYDNLKVHDNSYPTPDYLRSIVFVGDEDASHVPQSFKASAQTPGMEPQIDPTTWAETQGSKAIVRILLDDDPRPVFILAWGGGNTAAKAFQVLKDKHPKDYQRAISKAVMYNIWYQDVAGSYIERYHPDVTMLLSYHFHGTWDYGAQLFTSGFVSEYLHRGHGKLAADYVQDYISEGDSPAFLYTLDNGLRSYEHPSYGGWGGRFYKVPGTHNVWRDTDKGCYQRWTEYVLRDMMMRLVWCVTPEYGKCNHPPHIDIDGALNRTVHSGEQVTLRAIVTDDNFIDADLQWNHRRAVQEQKGTTREKFVSQVLSRPQAMETAWWQYSEAGTYPAMVDLQKTSDPYCVTFTAPRVNTPQALHFVFEVTDNNKIGLTAFARVIVNVIP